MPRRELIRIDEERCDGCGRCVTACAEGAIELVGGKARLVSETYCDGLGACVGECPRGAITRESVEAALFDGDAVTRRLARRSPGPPAASLPSPASAPLPAASPSHAAPVAHGCRGSLPAHFAVSPPRPGAPQPSQLRQWPVQLHLLSPQAPYLRGADLLLAADCVAFALGDFHNQWLAGRSLAIACPKLDTNQNAYLEKLTAMTSEGGVKSLTVMVMEVPCCSGLVRLAQQAVAAAGGLLCMRVVVAGIRGDVLAVHELPPPSSHP